MKLIDKSLSDQIQKKDLPKIKQFLRDGANPNARTDDGHPLIALALLTEELSIVKALLEAKADPNITLSPGRDQAVIILATQANDSSFINLLHSYGADLNKVMGEKHITPLMMACTRGKGTVVNALLQCGADLNAKDIHGSNAFHYAANDGNIDALEILKKHDDNNVFDQVNNVGVTPLACSIMAQSYQSALMLHQWDADLIAAENYHPEAYKAFATHIQTLEILSQEKGIGIG